MRDGNRCRNCGANAKLSVHHIVKARNGGRDTLDNLVTLCASCHRRADAKAKGVFSGATATPQATGANTSRFIHSGRLRTTSIRIATIAAMVRTPSE
jgi:hypothetical protein